MLTNTKIYFFFATFAMALKSGASFPPQAVTDSPRQTSEPHLMAVKIGQNISPAELEDEQTYQNINSYEIQLDRFIVNIYRKLDYINVLHEDLKNRISKSSGNLIGRLDSYKVNDRTCTYRHGYEQCVNREIPGVGECKQFLPDKDQYKISIELLSKVIIERMLSNKSILKSKLDDLILSFNITKSNYQMNVSECVDNVNANQCNVNNNNWLKETIKDLNKQRNNIRDLLQALFNQLRQVSNNITELEITIFKDVDIKLNNFSCCINKFKIKISDIDCEAAETEQATEKVEN